MWNKIRTVIFGGSTPASPLADAGLTVLRVGAGLSMALAHGWSKVSNEAMMEQVVAGVDGMGFPMPTFFAWAASLSEFLGGLLLAIGLATRPAALFVLGTMGVAFFVAHARDPFHMKEMAFLYGIIMIAFLFAGSGRYSVDRFLRKA